MLLSGKIPQVIIALIAAGATTASASTFSFYDSSGDAIGAVVAGKTFDVSIKLSATDAFSAYSLFLRDPVYAGTTQFTVTKRTLITGAGGNPFTDTSTADSTFLNSPINTSSESTHDLGYSGSSAAIGDYNLMTLSITASAALSQGPHMIGFSSFSGMTSPELTDLPDPTLGTYTINVAAIPEPASLGLLAITGMIVLARRNVRA